MPLLKRPHYFAGKLLTAQDLAEEQEYHLQKQRLRNLAVLGSGVASGLRISLKQNGILVTPGLAIDHFGREIIIPEPQLVPFPLSRTGTLLVLSYKETPTDPVPNPTWNEVDYTRIEEGFVFETVDAANAGQLVLARLKQSQDRWIIERRRSFVPPWVMPGAFILGVLLSFAIRKGRR